MSGEIGELFGGVTEVTGRWRIPKFLSLLVEVNKKYRSPKFLFWGSCWCFEIYRTGETGNAEWVSLYLQRMDHGLPMTLNLSVDLENKSRQGWISRKEKFIFLAPELRGWEKLERITDELQRRFSPSDDLIIQYRLQPLTSRKDFSCNLLSRLWNVNQVLTSILQAEKKEDVTLKLKDGEILAHKVVLKSRSPVFNRMFDVGMSESETGVVNIQDATVDTFQVVLAYFYSGDPKGLNKENAMDVYRLADKYELYDLGQLCTALIQDTITPDTALDVYEFSDFFQEEALKKCAVNCVVLHKSEILESEKWRKLKTENCDIAFNLLENSLLQDK